MFIVKAVELCGIQHITRIPRLYSHKLTHLPPTPSFTHRPPYMKTEKHLAMPGSFERPTIALLLPLRAIPDVPTPIPCREFYSGITQLPLKCPLLALKTIAPLHAGAPPQSDTAAPPPRNNASPRHHPPSPSCTCIPYTHHHPATARSAADSSLRGTSGSSARLQNQPQSCIPAVR